MEIALMDLKEWGMAGIFIAYLIYDRQIIIKGLMTAINNLSDKIENMGKCK